MLKSILAGAAALALVGSTAVSAQDRSGAPERARWQLSQEDIAAYAAARIAGLKAGLVMTAEQEKHWPAFEAALKDLSRYRSERRAARQAEQPATSPTDRLRRYADALNGYGAVLKKLADAQEPLYNSLDDAQKRRFAVLSRPARQGATWRHRGEQRRQWQRGGYERRGEDGQRGERRHWRGGHERGDRRGFGGEQRL
jgi:hypothetical protein